MSTNPAHFAPIDCPRARVAQGSGFPLSLKTSVRSPDCSSPPKLPSACVFIGGVDALLAPKAKVGVPLSVRLVALHDI